MGTGGVQEARVPGVRVAGRSPGREELRPRATAWANSAVSLTRVMGPWARGSRVPWDVASGEWAARCGARAALFHVPTALADDGSHEAGRVADTVGGSARPARSPVPGATAHSLGVPQPHGAAHESLPAFRGGGLDLEGALGLLEGRGRRGESARTMTRQRVPRCSPTTTASWPTRCSRRGRQGAGTAESSNRRQ